MDSRPLSSTKKDVAILLGEKAVVDAWRRWRDGRRERRWHIRAASTEVRYMKARGNVRWWMGNDVIMVVVSNLVCES